MTLGLLLKFKEKWDGFVKKINTALTVKNDVRIYFHGNPGSGYKELRSCGCVNSEYLLDRWVRLLLECEINANLSTFIKLHICLFSLAPIGGGRLIWKFPFHALGSINRIFFKLTYPNGNKVAILILNSKMWNNFFGRILPTLIYSSVICLVFVHSPHARI